MSEIRPVEGGPHDLVHTAVRALERRRPYTAETDALVTLLRGMCERHQVPVYPDPNRRCSCGALIPWGDVLRDEPCPEMRDVLDLAGAIVEDDQRELVSLNVARRTVQGGGAR
ncbi:hypothetical protein [Actinomadura sediminis]|uniref:Uncharacterized protein n=1 Tax=Actinomadura sediminis TaxID=1038904 RepID=A0ABW3ERU2_9ACTN